MNFQQFTFIQNMKANWRYEDILVQMLLHMAMKRNKKIFQWTLYVIYLLTLSGMPPNQLNVKDGVIAMLLRNLNPSEGLCDRTQLIVKRLMPNLID